VQRRLAASGRKVQAIKLGELGLHAGRLLGGEHGKHLRQGQTNDAQDLGAGRYRQSHGVEGMSHGRTNFVLAVDQRTVAIEDDELHGRLQQ
jgi:hypothetical protein